MGEEKNFLKKFFPFPSRFCGVVTFYAQHKTHRTSEVCAAPFPFPKLSKRNKKMLEFIQENMLLTIIAAYLLIMSLISVIVCIYDKKISKKNNVKLRVPEKTLLLLSALGGGVAMYLCMLSIRHKTKHVKFMLGIPLIIAAQAVAVYLLFHYGIF